MDQFCRRRRHQLHERALLFPRVVEKATFDGHARVVDEVAHAQIATPNFCNELLRTVDIGQVAAYRDALCAGRLYNLFRGLFKQRTKSRGKDEAMASLREWNG